MPGRDPGQRGMLSSEESASYGIFDGDSVVGTSVDGFGDEQMVMPDSDDINPVSTGGGTLQTTAPAPKTPVYVPPATTVKPPVAPPKALAFYEGDWMGLPKIAWYGAGALLAVVLISKAMKKPSYDEDYGY